MDENPYKSPREYGFCERLEGEPPRRYDPLPPQPLTPWLVDRDAVVIVAATAFIVTAVVILFGVLGWIPAPPS